MNAKDFLSDKKLLISLKDGKEVDLKHNKGLEQLLEDYHQEKLQQLKRESDIYKDITDISYSDKKDFMKAIKTYKESWNSLGKEIDRDYYLHFWSGAEYLYNRLLERIGKSNKQ